MQILIALRLYYSFLFCENYIKADLRTPKRIRQTFQKNYVCLSSRPTALEIVESTAISCYHVAPLTKLPREKYH
jgi:hypothetical protein